MFEQDFIKRLIRQLMQASARALGMAPKQPMEALEAVGDAKRELPLLPDVLDQLTPASALQMLGGREPALALFRLYQAEAAAHAQLGDAARTQRSRRRAVLFFLEVPDASRDDATRAEALALARQLPEGQLTAAQLTALA